MIRERTVAARRDTCRPGPWTAVLATALFLGALLPASAQGTAWDLIAPLFKVPDTFVDQFGAYRSPLVFPDGTPVRTAADWERRRQQLLAEWHELPARIDYIFVSRQVAVSRASVVIDEQTRLAADHYPVIAEIALPGS